MAKRIVPLVVSNFAMSCGNNPMTDGFITQSPQWFEYATTPISNPLYFQTGIR